MPHDGQYEQSLLSYFSQQEQALKPACVIKPESAQDVAVAVKILVEFGRYLCPFAIRGGGHTAWAGSANIDHGVTIDLSAMNKISLNARASQTSVGAGATWGEVYSQLDPLNLTVIGGRASQVGVAGLTLGGKSSSTRILSPYTDHNIGGISYLSPRYGFVCDNVLNFEVVVASGNIINANDQEHTDLYQALKGGSNNFGVVTRFDFKTVPLEQIWGGQVVFGIDQFTAALESFSNFTVMKPYDEYATTIQSAAYVEGFGFVGVNDFEYTKAVENPHVFDLWNKVQPRVQSTLRLAKLKNITDEQGSFSPDGLR